MGWDMDGCPFGGCRTSLSPGSLRQGKGLFERLLDVPTGPFLPRWVTTNLPPSVSSVGLRESQASPRPPRLAATHLPVARPSVGVPGCCISRQCVWEGGSAGWGLGMIVVPRNTLCGEGARWAHLVWFPTAEPGQRDLPEGRNSCFLFNTQEI